MDITETEKMKMAARIKEAREWKGLTQVDLSGRLKVARQTYLDLESGKTEPKVTMVARIAEITERPLTWFVYGDAGMEVLKLEHEDEVEQLLMHFSRLPMSARNVILRQSIQMAKFLGEYTKALTTRP